MSAVCLKTKRGNFTSACLVTETPVQPIPSQEGAPWDSSHSTPAGSLVLSTKPLPHQISVQPQLCHTLSFPLAFTDTVHPQCTECLGLLGGYKGVSPSLPQQRAVPQPSRALASHALWTTSAKHSATTCAVLSLDQLAADPCLVLPFL